MEACTSAGVAKYGEPLSLSDSAGLTVDMIVVGSSAVSRNGARLGKGEVSVQLPPVSAHQTEMGIRVVSSGPITMPNEPIM